MSGYSAIQPRNRTSFISCDLPIQWGEFRLSAIVSQQTGLEHSALTMGIVDDGEPVLARIHSECLTGDSVYIADRNCRQ
jgi:GTP cyclohydrolase II